MTPESAVEIIRQAFWTALMAGAPILAVGFLAGIAMSVVQILTSIQDSAFSTVPRLLVFAAAAMLLLPWMAGRLLGYAQQIFGGLDRFAG